eukprot:365694-Chlamydomonas_euryale.AAC.10
MRSGLGVPLTKQLPRLLSSTRPSLTSPGTPGLAAAFVLQSRPTLASAVGKAVARPRTGKLP